MLSVGFGFSLGVEAAQRGFLDGAVFFVLTWTKEQHYLVLGHAAWPTKLGMMYLITMHDVGDGGDDDCCHDDAGDGRETEKLVMLLMILLLMTMVVMLMVDMSTR